MNKECCPVFFRASFRFSRFTSNQAFTWLLNKAPLLFGFFSLLFSSQKSGRQASWGSRDQAAADEEGECRTSTTNISVSALQHKKVTLTPVSCSWVNGQPSRSCRPEKSWGSTSTWKSPTPRITIGELTSPGPSWLLLTRYSLSLPPTAESIKSPAPRPPFSPCSPVVLFFSNHSSLQMWWERVSFFLSSPHTDSLSSMLFDPGSHQEGAQRLQEHWNGGSWREQNLHKVHFCILN